MSDIINNAANRQMYTAYEGHNMLGKISKVILSVAPGGMQVSAFSDGGEFLTTAGYTQDGNKGEWTQDFFENQFINERLFNDVSKLHAIFVATHKGMLVPKTLYREDAARDWLGKIFLVEKDETVLAHLLDEEKAYYVYAVPEIVDALIQRYFPKADILPFAAHQFGKIKKTDMLMQCTLTQRLAVATLYKGKRLQWHQVFAYDNAEEVAYRLKAAMQRYNMPDCSMQMLCDGNTLNDTLAALEAYFPDAGFGKNEVADEVWKPAVNLAQMLYSCAS